MKRIVLAEDDNSYRDLLVEVLTQAGYEVTNVNNGYAALQHLRTQPADLVITDIMMPSFGGYDLLDALRAHPDTAQVPVVLITGRLGYEGQRQGLARGADDYLPKPFTMEELLTVVSQQLAKRAPLPDAGEKKLAVLRDSISLALPQPVLAPLQSIREVADLLADGNVAQTEQTNFAALLGESCNRLQRLLQNFLLDDQVGLLAHEPEKIAQLRATSVCTTGRWVETMAKSIAQGHHRPDDVTVSVPVLSLRIQKDHLDKILTELLDNAFKFSAIGSPVTITCVVEGKNAVFTINDGGLGMAPETIKRLGESRSPGLKALTQGGGSGLGAAVARGLVNLYAGSVRWDSAPAHGCSAIFSLPIAETPAPVAAPSPSAAGTSVAEESLPRGGAPS